MTGEPIFTLVIERGAPFYAHAWPLIDRQGNYTYDPAGVDPRCACRPWPGSFRCTVLATSVVMLPGPSGPPVVGVQIDAMTRQQTEALADLDGFGWALAVDGDPIVSGLVAMSWAITREAVQP